MMCSSYFHGRERKAQNVDSTLHQGIQWKDWTNDQAIKHQSCLQNPDYHTTEIWGWIKGVVYKVPCECDAVYTGETGRNLHTRLQQHKLAVINGYSKNGIATHVMDNNHKIQLEEAQVIASELHLTKRKVKESTHQENTELHEPWQGPTTGQYLVPLDKIVFPLFFSLFPLLLTLWHHTSSVHRDSHV